MKLTFELSAKCKVQRANQSRMLGGFLPTDLKTPVPDLFVMCNVCLVQRMRSVKAMSRTENLKSKLALVTPCT